CHGLRLFQRGWRMPADIRRSPRCGHRVDDAGRLGSVAPRAAAEFLCSRARKLEGLLMNTRHSCAQGRNRSGSGQRGFALLEALVAFAVMAVGVLGTIALQSTLRYSGDIAKQQSEATRIAQAEIERLRAFATLSTYDGMASRGDADVGGYGANTTYTL